MLLPIFYMAIRFQDFVFLYIPNGKDVFVFMNDTGLMCFDDNCE